MPHSVVTKVSSKMSNIHSSKISSGRDSGAQTCNCEGWGHCPAGLNAAAD